MVVDWSKAPEEATHWGAGLQIDLNSSWSEGFWQQSGDLWRIYEEHNKKWGRWIEESVQELIEDRVPTLIKRPKPKEDLGVYRPNLEDRKIGKVQMELVDTGFPNALFALGEVMTWAAENKGYKPNDWKNLPDSYMAFTGAASRHRTKRLMGQELDDESFLLHLSHEAFNILALLETTLLGKQNE